MAAVTIQCRAVTPPSLTTTTTTCRPLRRSLYHLENSRAVVMRTLRRTMSGSARVSRIFSRWSGRRSGWRSRTWPSRSAVSSTSPPSLGHGNRVTRSAKVQLTLQVLENSSRRSGDTRIGTRVHELGDTVHGFGDRFRTAPRHRLEVRPEDCPRAACRRHLIEAGDGDFARSQGFGQGLEGDVEPDPMAIPEAVEGHARPDLACDSHQDDVGPVDAIRIRAYDNGSSLLDR